MTAETSSSAVTFVWIIWNKTQYPEELTVLEACFHHGNSTVELIKEYERCMETEGHPGLEDLLARMDQEKAWEYEQKAKQILSQLKIRNFDQRVKQAFRRTG